MPCSKMRSENCQNLDGKVGSVCSCHPQLVNRRPQPLLARDHLLQTASRLYRVALNFLLVGSIGIAGLDE